MQVTSERHRLELPERLRAQMYAYRRRVWKIKLAEAGCAALFGILAAFLLTFALDRVWNTPAVVRLGLFVAAALGCALLPWATYRWIWRRRRFEQLARLLSRTHPRIGDQLLGVIELVHSDSEQARSLALCEAAVQQVSQRTRDDDFADAVPNPAHRRWALLAAGTIVAAIGLGTLYPAAAANAWMRFAMPWRDTPRYTFAMLDVIPDSVIVPHGEPFSLTARLTEQTQSRPQQAKARIGKQQIVVASLSEDRYHLQFPPQIDEGRLDLQVGDFTQTIRIIPTLRPELTAVTADVELPEYLGRSGVENKDVRGGSITLVHGSKAKFSVTASRALASARVDGEPAVVQGDMVSSPEVVVKDDRELIFEWRDHLGLEGKEPFKVDLNGRVDEAPSVICNDLPRRRVVLVSEQLSFNLTAHDDFGVKRVGIDWQGLDKVNFKNPAKGERLLAAGSHETEKLELAGTFCAESLGIEPQPIHVRLFVEDYLPGRKRVYSPEYLFYVLSAEQHAIWITEQFNKWHRQSLDVRDRELQLYETNKKLRQLSDEDLEKPETRRRIEQQARAERANSRRLSGLVVSGEELVKQAMRNPEFGVGHLEKWAEMLQILKDISANRMPSVADLLKQASQSPALAKASKNPTVGQIRASAGGKSPAAKKDDEPSKPGVGNIVDLESSQQPLKPKDDEEEAPPASSGASRLTLPVTTLLGGGPKGGACPVGEKMDQAIEEQRALLAEFEKVADELNRLLANLEGSTLVKRLKAESRAQYKIAGRLADQVSKAFGVPAAATAVAQRQLFDELSTREEKSSLVVSYIMDDMDAYFERRRFMRFKAVLDEMRKSDVIGALRQLSDQLQQKNGLAIAQCEFWSDTLDRWAEDLVEPAAGGT